MHIIGNLPKNDGFGSSSELLALAVETLVSVTWLRVHRLCCRRCQRGSREFAQIGVRKMEDMMLHLYMFRYICITSACIYIHIHIHHVPFIVLLRICLSIIVCI